MNSFLTRRDVATPNPNRWPGLAGAFGGSIDDIFNDFWRPFAITPILDRNSSNTLSERNGGFGRNFVPAVDIQERDKELIVTAELAGLDEKDVQIDVTRDALTISGEKRWEKEEKDKERSYSERRYGSFKRSIALPYEIDQERAEARFKNGILTVTLPRDAKSTPDGRRLTIKA